MILYQNWTISENCIPKIKIISENVFSKILLKFNESLELNYKNYDPWMIPALSEERFIQLINKNNKSIIEDSENNIMLINKIFFNISIEEENKIKFEKYFGIPVNYFRLENNEKITFKFKNMFEKSLEIISIICPWIKNLYNLLVKKVYFLEPEIKNIKAMSTHFLKGAIIFRASNSNSIIDCINLAVDIVHEIGHQVLMHYLTADRIILSSYNQLIFSGAKNADRPAIKSLHSAIALTYMIYFLNNLNNIRNIIYFEDFKIFEIKRDKFKMQLEKNLNSLLKNCKFTNLGEIIITEIYSYNNI